MSNELAVDVERLRDAARFAKDKAQTIRDELTRLDNTIGKELLVDGWQGKAASAYDESWLEWKAGAETVIAALEQSATAWPMPRSSTNSKTMPPATRSPKSRYWISHDKCRRIQGQPR
ncbi:WXG100 family type VII secretion target [Nocardia sp. NPDC058497]|uniref:WXG100 family type VII secretion target n=1 Tax=Nocardia sp. NPDC058497 TaxID=3346529 RepID=UPI0036569A1E